jgi:hypothetical protein
VQNEAVIPIPEPEGNGSITQEQVDAAIRRTIESLGINPDFLNIPEMSLCSSIVQKRVEEQQALLDDWRKSYNDFVGRVSAAYQERLAMEREYVGDEQGVRMPRTNEDGTVKETVTIVVKVGRGLTEFYVPYDDHPYQRTR